jgi:hypothetical protein
MKSILLLTYCLAIGIPLGLAIWSKRKRTRIGDQANADAKSDCTPETEIVETIEALAIALRSRGDETMADNLLNAFYGASTGTELRMGLRYVMQSIDRRKLKSDVALLIRAERLLS